MSSSCQRDLKRTSRPPHLGFHIWMATSCAILLAVSLAGRFATSAIGIPTFATVIVPILELAAVAWLPLYWNEKAKPNLRDASATLPWAILLTVLLPMPVVVAARLGMHRPLNDALFAHLDQQLGVSVPGIFAWAQGTVTGRIIDRSYPLVMVWLAIAALLPALTGKVRRAQEFLSANVIAFAIGLPIFGILPAVGPWYGYHFPPAAGQQACELSLSLLRNPGQYIFQSAGVVCFPSFHVVFAILCARAMWDYRWLRIPSLLFGGIIILSTMTTGWHYFVDVLGGAALAIIALLTTTAVLNFIQLKTEDSAARSVLVHAQSNSAQS